jgi:heme exporter protein CcmD
MRDPTFYIVGAYGMTALVVIIELAWLRHQRQRAMLRARQIAEEDQE